METYEKWNIQELPLSTPYFRCQVERFLEANGLRMEALDAYFAVQDAQGHLLAGAGLQGDILKCVAVAASFRSEGLMVPLVSHVISVAASRGILNLKVFTKPEHQAVFESLGFRLLAAAPEAILLENGRGLERYCAYLRTLRRPGRSGVIVMNANPFTLGHQYLIDRALAQVETLYVIPVREERSMFPYTERLAMIKEASPVFPEESTFLSDDGNTGDASSNAARVIVAEGSAYCISAATFPTYFLKDLSAAAETQMRLDIDLFARWIAPALGNPVRFVGSEPGDPLTARYNALLQEGLPQVVVIPRLELSAGPTAEENYFSQGFAKNQFSPAIATPTLADAAVMPGSERTSRPVSASAVRDALDRGCFREAADLCPATTWPYLLAALAERALRMELDTPLKPGLVGPDGPGAHKDMDYALMLKGIAAIRPFFARMAMARDTEELRQLGIDAEKAMLSATGGVNTHRGAIFCLGVTLNAWAQGAHNEQLMRSSLVEIARGIYDKSQNISKLPPRAAMANVLGGYKDLFEDWLPFYRHQCHLAGERRKETEAGEGLSVASTFSLAEERPSPVLAEALREETFTALKARQLLLLKMMSTLDDTCVVKRVGAERAEQVKQQARALFEKMAGQAGYDGQQAGYDGRQSGYDGQHPVSDGCLQEMCVRYAAEGISPGGAADMLALTIFIDSILS